MKNITLNPHIPNKLTPFFLTLYIHDCNYQKKLNKKLIKFWHPCCKLTPHIHYPYRCESFSGLEKEEPGKRLEL